MFNDRCLNALVQLNNVKPEDVVRTDEQTRKKLLNHCRHVMRLCDEAQRSASHAIEPKVRAHWKQGGGAVTDRERREKEPARAGGVLAPDRKQIAVARHRAGVLWVPADNAEAARRDRGWQSRVGEAQEAIAQRH